MAVNYTNIKPENLKNYGIELYNPWNDYTKAHINWYNTLQFDSVTADTANNVLICTLYYQLRAKFSNTKNITPDNKVYVTFNLRDKDSPYTIYDTVTITVTNMQNNSDVISPATPVQLTIPSTLPSYDLLIEYDADMTDMGEGNGIYWETPSIFIRNIRGAALLDVTNEAQPILKQPPVMTGISNANKYKNQNDVSASNGEISVTWTASTKDDDPCTGAQYRYSKVDSSGNLVGWSNWIEVSSSGNSGTIVISKLTEYTKYKIEIRAKNSTGLSNSSLGITIRTRHAPGVLSCKASEVHIDEAVLLWSSNKNLADLQYSLDGGSWISVSTNKSNTGTFTLTKLSYNTYHKVNVKATTTADNDDQPTHGASAEFTTLDIARLTSIENLIFGEPLKFNFSKPDTTKCTIYLNIKKSDGTNIEDKKQITVSPAVSNPSQSILDSIYKLFKRSNTQQITVQISTKTNYTTYDDTRQTAVLTLTGIAKTGHAGVNNKQKRVQFYIGDSNNKTKKAVCWVGVNNKSKRTI